MIYAIQREGNGNCLITHKFNDCSSYFRKLSIRRLLTIEELLVRLNRGVSKKTLQRDLVALSEDGITLISKKSGGNESLLVEYNCIDMKLRDLKQSEDRPDLSGISQSEKSKIEWYCGRATSTPRDECNCLRRDLNQLCISRY